MAWRRKIPISIQPLRRSLRRLVVMGLLLLGAGTLLSDGGVLADEGSGAILLPDPTAEPPSMLPPAKVLQMTARGWLEVMRPGGSRLAPVAVVTGFDRLSSQESKPFSENTLRFREQVKAGNDGARIRCGLGNSLYLEGDLAGAVQAFVWASAGYPDDPDVRNGLGNVLAELGLVGQAQSEFGELTGRPDYQAIAYNNLGNAFKNASRLSEALALYARALQIDPDLVAAHYNSGITFMELDQPERAADSFRNVTRRLPEFGEGYLYEGLTKLRVKDPIGAAVALYRAMDLGQSSPALHLGLGLATQELELHEEAVKHLALSLQDGPQDQRIYHLLASSLIRVGKLDRAAEVFEQAFELGTKDADAHFYLGLKLFMCEQPESAAEHLMQAVLSGRRDADVFFSLGQALLQTGRLQEALKTLSIAAQLKPKSPEIHFSLGLTLDRLGQTVEATRAMKAACDFDPADPDYPVLLMDLQLRTGEFRACFKTGKALIDSHPEMVVPRFESALCLAMAGELDRAAEAMEDALDQDLDGEAVLSMWNKLEGLKVTDQSHPGIFMLLGLIQERRGNWSQAVIEWERFILLSSSRSWKRKALARIRALAPK